MRSFVSITRFAAVGKPGATFWTPRFRRIATSSPCCSAVFTSSGTGHGPNEQAFAAGLLRGARGRVVADRFLAEWNAEAIAHDRRYRALEHGEGQDAGMLALFPWYYIVKQNPLSWLGLMAVVAFLGGSARSKDEGGRMKDEG